MARQSLLWEFHQPGGKVSWLFGTMHVKDDRAYQILESLYRLIQRSDHFMGEMDLDSMSLSQVSGPQYNIRAYFDEKTFEKIRRCILRFFGMDLDHFGHLHPMMITSLLSVSVLEAEHQINLDEHLWQFAKESGKPVSGLESYQAQFDLLHSIDPAPHYKHLKAICRNPGLIRKTVTKSLELYLAGRIHALYMLSKSSLQELRKKLIYDRNEHMAAVIVELDTSKQYFITVGAGHLSGQFGLIRQLKNRGIQIRASKELQYGM